MKELPLKLDASITAQCLAFFRTAIIETTQSGQEWVSSHYNIFMDKDDNLFFGDGMAYHDILQHDCIPIETFDANHIIDFFQKTIDEGYYIIVDVNFKYLFSNHENEFDMHEILLYGYDEDAQVFLSPQQSNSDKFSRTGIKYDALRKAFASLFEHYKVNPTDKFERYYLYTYPITRLKLKEAKTDQNLLVLNALRKIETEYIAQSKEVTKYDIDTGNASEYTQYIGLGCLIGFKNKIHSAIDDENFDFSNTSMVRYAYLLYEHMNILKSTILLLKTKLNINDSIFDEAYDTYCAQIPIMQQCYLLILKFELTGDKSSLTNIIEHFDSIYENQFRALRTVFEIAKKQVCRYL